MTKRTHHMEFSFEFGESIIRIESERENDLKRFVKCVQYGLEAYKHDDIRAELQRLIDIG